VSGKAAPLIVIISVEKAASLQPDNLVQGAAAAIRSGIAL
jgi:hypothetical protein